ncbi:MAG TPA: RNA 3'-terminal phosphate cyclase [Candidatus Brocadiia bacterium]|nr:RNA 3'-terminal phosphate cyclase [Candidatus Brocadiia bacterium]
MIDGSSGEGGGQILRSALTLSAWTGRPARLINIRRNRTPPGLKAQHLCAAEAVAAICGGRIEGGRIGSSEMRFLPGKVQPGSYHFSVGTAGSATLVLQTCLLPLAFCGAESIVTVAGGSHVEWSPSFHYLNWAWDRMVRQMGYSFDLELSRAGFYPRGGGEAVAHVNPASELKSFKVLERGRLQWIQGISAVGNLSGEIAERGKDRAIRRLRGIGAHVDIEASSLPAAGKGAFVAFCAMFEASVAAFCALGKPGKPMEQVADEAADELINFLEREGAVDAHMADQLVLPAALSGKEIAYSTVEVTRHLQTNAEVVNSFGIARVEVDGPIGMKGVITVRPC